MNYFAHAGEEHATKAEARAHEAATAKAQLDTPQPDGIVNSGFLLAAVVVLLIGGSLAAYFTFNNRK